ncbi:helicase/secretion neighborhood TadE-like protein [Nocardioides scoriae]|uniref:Helicase/secretion neighborhood TadE-like protein n=1 Tax=Nocardioides scoriae TaxID=642780 RepID=A0A1H1UDC0_9ACTN|nr:Rv3654c family TadE-like protein [Nocardioides scoriae]SDS70216.1 helicase/secretion neighborhood TadE-like protein [Nocardioides scoriae]
MSTGRAAPASGRAAARGVGRAGECGAAAVVATALLGVLLTATLAAGGVVGVVAAHRVAQSAADLAALAAARAVQDGRDPCAAAAGIATANRARLGSCRVSGWEVTVEAVARTGRLPGGPLELHARARAGPTTSLEPPG